MKKTSKLIKILVLCFGVFFASCETTELDLTENPNALSPDQADPDFFLNAIQIQFAYLTESFGNTAGQVTRIDYMSGRDYNNAYSPSNFDGRWSQAYQTIMLDIKQMNAIADESGLTHHKGVGQVIEAHILMTLVDFFGDIPYTEALQGVDNLNPTADSGASVYEAAIALLDDAIANFNSDASAEPALDMYYDGDWTAWIKAANTLKMKAYITTRLVDGNAISKFNAIVASGNYISSNGDDFQFRWGTNEVQPDSRHPRYRSSYTATGGGSYMSNSLMYYMIGNNPESAYLNPNRFDPRTLYYFYRQVGATPGIAGEPADEEVLECGLQSAPSHYDGYVFCGVPLGWWGRDHGNDNGIPPDGFLRTLAGAYPAGGALDDLSYESKVNGDGNGGNGITPIMLASWAKFMIAESNMANSNFAGAKSMMLDGIDLSISKVTSFTETSERYEWIFGTGLRPGGDPDDPDDYGPALTLLSNYINWFTDDLSSEWDVADENGKWNILSMQYFVAQYGNGLDAYNFYRRTGNPKTLQPNIEPNPGGFIRSFFYPANHANTNSNITQKDNVGVQVFWDTNPASPSFPEAN